MSRSLQRVCYVTRVLVFLKNCASTLLKGKSSNKCYLPWMVARDWMLLCKLPVSSTGRFWWILKYWYSWDGFYSSFSSPQYIFFWLVFFLLHNSSNMCVGGERFNSDLTNSGSFCCSTLTLCCFGNFLHKMRITKKINIIHTTFSYLYSGVCIAFIYSLSSHLSL